MGIVREQFGTISQTNRALSTKVIGGARYRYNIYVAGGQPVGLIHSALLRDSTMVRVRLTVED